MQRTTKDLLNEIAVKIFPQDTRAYKFALMTFFYITHKLRLKPKKSLYVEFPLSGHCNQNCISCGAFSPLSEKEFLNYSIFKKDIARLADIDIGHNLVKMLIFTGGEPLLNPEIIKFIELAHQYFPNCVINIQTNGILLGKMPEKFWTACKDNNVRFSLTNYPTLKESDIAAVIKKMNEYNLKFYFFGGKIKMMYKIPLDINGGHNDFKICHWANCNARLKNGSLYGCGYRAYINKLNEYFNLNFKVSNEDRMNIYEVKGTDEISNFIANPTPFCHYCNIREAIFGELCRESARKLKEWIH